MQRIGMIGRTRARLPVPGVALALALAAGGAGAAECETELSAVLAETPDVSQLPPDQAVLARRTLRDMAAAAQQLGAEGHEVACAATLDAIAKAMTDYKINLIDREPSGTIKGAEDLIVPEAALDVRDPRLMPLTAEGLAFATREIEGNAVFNYEGERIGEFEGLLSGPGGYATHVVIGHGGFWDMFDDRAAIPVDLVRWDSERRLFYVPFGEEALEDAPEYDSEAAGWDADMNDEYFAGLAE